MLAEEFSGWWRFTLEIIGQPAHNHHNLCDQARDQGSDDWHMLLAASAFRISMKIIVKTYRASEERDVGGMTYSDNMRL